MKLRFALIALPLLVPMYAAQATSSLDEHQRKADRIEQGLTPIYSIAGETPKHSIQDFMARDNIPGVSITFIDSGRIAWSRTYGYADIAAQVPVTTDTVFTAASVSKPVSAMAALALVDQGVLDLDTDANNYLEGWKVPENEHTEKEKVTLRRLLSHTAGFNRYFHSRYAPGVQRPTVEQMLRGEAPSKDRGAKLIYEPGSGYKYSNPGYLVVEELITDVTDQPFEKVLDERVLQPAGMQSSSFAQPITGDLAERKATGYSANGKPYPYAAYAFKALGGLWTTTNDLGRWLITLLNDHHTGDATLLSQELTQQVFNEQGDRLIFSLWAWKDDLVFRHTGHNPGFTSFVFGSVDKQQALIVMTNSDNTQDLFDHLQRAVADTYQWDYFRSEVFDVYEGETIDRRKASLQYDWNGQYVNFSEEKTGFYMQINNERFLLTPIAANEFLAEEKSIKVVFDGDNLSEVVIWKANGDRTSAQRM